MLIGCCRTSALWHKDGTLAQNKIGQEQDILLQYALNYVVIFAFCLIIIIMFLETMKPSKQNFKCCPIFSSANQLSLVAENSGVIVSLRRSFEEQKALVTEWSQNQRSAEAGKHLDQRCVSI